MAKGANNVSKKRLGSSKPYDVSNSFVKQVADRMSNLLPQTSWLNRWLLPSSSSVEDTNCVSNAVPCESGDVDSELPPPTKRARIPLHQSFSAESFLVSKPTIRIESDDREEAGPSGLSSFPRSRLVSSTPATQLHTDPTTHSHTDQLSPIVNGDDGSDSGESTSGCSSLVPQGTRQSFNNESTNNSMSVKRASVDERDFSTYLQSSRIFPNRTTPSPCLNTSNSRQGPSFNASLYTLPFSTRSPSIDKSFSSPFYPGPTTYGGASATRKPRNGFFSPSEILPVTKSIQVKPINRSDSSELSSVTARRILDTLDELSSPVRDAKRVPLMTPSTRKRKIETATSGSPGPPTQDLTIPTVPDLLKLHRRMKLQDSLESARLIASSSSETQGPVSSEYQQRLQKEATKHTGKITSRTKETDDDPHQDVQLPSIALPITTLPKFDFLLPEPPQDGFRLKRAADVSAFRSDNESFSPFVDKPRINTISSEKPPEVNLPLTKVPVTQTPVSSSVNFIPSCPSKVSSPYSQTRLKEKPKIDQSAEGNGPVESTGVGISVAGELKSGSVMDILGKPNNIFGAKLPGSFGKASQPDSVSEVCSSTSKPDQNLWECNTCLVANKGEASQCLSCKTPRSMSKAPVSSTKSLATSKQSVITPSNAPVVSTGFGSQFKLPIGTWVCDSCMVQNKLEASACIACTAAKPGLKSSSKTETSSVGFDKKFLPAVDTWECVTCMVRNKVSLEYCAACESKKPGGTANLPAAKPTVGFGNMFKKPEGSWDCPDCMVVNKEVLKCVACGAAKPGTAKATNDSAVTSTSTTPGFGDMFKRPEGSWECPDCMLLNKDVWKCVACEASKPGVQGFGDMFKPPEGSWECPDCMISNKNTLKCVACEAPKPGTEKQSKPASSTKFNFGIPPEAKTFKFGIDKAGDASSAGSTAATNKPTTANFKFGVDKSGDTKSVGETVTTNNVNFKFGTSSSASGTTGFTFGNPTTKSSTLNTPSGFSFGSNSTAVSKPETTASLFTFGVPPSEKKPLSQDSDKEKTNSSAPTSNVTEVKSSVDNTQLNKVRAQSPFLSTPIKSDEPTKPHESSPAMKFGAPVSTASSLAAATSAKLNGPSMVAPTIVTTGAVSVSSSTPTFGSISTSKVVTTAPGAFGTSATPLFGGFSTGATPTFGQPTTNTTTASSTTAFGAQAKPASTFSFAPPASVGQKRSCDDEEERIPGGKKQAAEFPSLPGKVGSGIFGSVANASAATGTSAPVPTFGSVSTSNAGFKGVATPAFGNSFPSASATEKLAAPSAPFVFGAAAAPPAVPFPPKQETSAPANLFSFGSSAPAPSPGGFNFSGTKPTGGFGFGPTAPAPTFGAPSAGPLPAPAPSGGGGFNFGGAAQQVPTSSAFSFSAATSTPAPVFAFGQSAAPAPTFDPNARPSFNFTGGEIPQFTAAGASVQPSSTVRRIKKAVRRQPR